MPDCFIILCIYVFRNKISEKNENDENRKLQNKIIK